MEFSLLLQNIRELWKEWDMRSLVLLSLFLQLTLATQVRRRKFIFRYWILVMVWTTYLSADSVATLTLGILSSRLANLQETRGTIDPKSQITAFWAPFLLLHLGGPDTITAYVQEDNELWLRQLARLCIQVGLACFIYFMVLSGSTLSISAAGMILVGFMKYAERILCLYLANKGRLRDSMLVLPNFAPILPRIMELYTLRKEEGYRVGIEEVIEVPAPEDLFVNGGQAIDESEALVMVKAYELFEIFKLLFMGFIRRFGDLELCKGMFMNNNIKPGMAFQIVEVELGLMYDLLYTKAPLLNCAWGIIRWVTSLSVLGAVLVFFSLQDKKDYAKVDICITFLLISVAILLEIYSLLLAISSDWADHWRIQRSGRSAILSALAFLRICPSPRWSNSVAQYSLLGLSIRRINRIFLKCPWLAKLDEKFVIFYLDCKEFKNNSKEWTFVRMRDTVNYLERNSGLKSRLTSLELGAREVLKRSGNAHLIWSVKEREFDQSILIWHIATELCYYNDREMRHNKSAEDISNFKMCKLVSRYMLYLILLHPSMLPTGIGVLRYQDTSVDVQKFLEGKQVGMSKREGIVSSFSKWARKLFMKERHSHTGVKSCRWEHKSRESRDLCEVCHLLLLKSDLREKSMHQTKSRSVLFDACYLASQLNNIESKDFGKKWDLIGDVWAKFLVYAAYQCKGHEHCESLSRGGELLSHIWLLLAHLGQAEAVQTFEPQSTVKLIIN